MDGHKDQGINVREKAKQLVALLKDDERLRNERARALKAKERFAQSVSGFGSDGLDTMSPVSSDVSNMYYIIDVGSKLQIAVSYKLLLHRSFRIGSLAIYLNQRLDVQVSWPRLLSYIFYIFRICQTLPHLRIKVKNVSPAELEAARPQTVGEEELQLQLALAMSREEAEQEEQRRRSDDVRLQLALSQSQQDFK